MKEEGIEILKCNIEKQLNYFVLNVDFTVENEILCIMGESGSRKTSILNPIAGILTPDKGDIILDDNVLFSDKINLKPQLRNIGCVFQDYALSPNMSVKDNIFFMNPDKFYTNSLIKKLGIKCLLQNLPDTLSGGEKQKVLIVRALPKKPDLLLMDEPFSSIDEKFKNKFYRELIEIKKSLDVPITMVTHNRHEAEILADKLILIDKGRIIK